METTTELFNTGLTITFIGMSVVFVLLTLLVGIVNVMSALCVRFAPEPASKASTDENEEIVSVIAAAISQYRRNHEA